MRAQMASRAMRMFWYDPRICIRVSASTIRVRVAFSMVNFVLPFCTRQGQQSEEGKVSFMMAMLGA